VVTGPNPPDKALALTAFLLCWIFYGVLWLIRTVPRFQALPRCIGEGFGVLDATLIVVAVSGLFYFLN
jgi:hypothetical protein